MAAITWVGQNLLITGHRRVEADLPVYFTHRAKRRTDVNRAIFKGQFCDLRHEPYTAVSNRATQIAAQKTENPTIEQRHHTAPFSNPSSCRHP